MNTRKGIYIVPTDHWYIERTVWLVAGAVVFGATMLATFHDTRWVVFVAATGLASINVSLNGFCIVGNVLQRLGFRGALADETRPKWYFMKTDRWYLERRIYIVVGTNLCIASVLALVHSRYWLIFPGFVGVAMFWFASTGFCIMANCLYWLGAEPRLRREGAPASSPAGLTPSSAS